MAKIVHADPTHRHDFILLFDVTDGNPNGDPDAGNLPRVDPETMQGMVTDVCLKRKVRNYVDATRGSQSRYKIFVENRGYLVDHKKRAYEAVGGKKGDTDTADKAREWLCKNYFDVRAFGAVLVGKKGQGYNCGQVRGSIQLTFGRSIDPVVPLDLSITRVALEHRGEQGHDDDDEKASTGTMGCKSVLPYGLYKSFGFVNPHFAKDTGLTADDLLLFRDAMQNMWDLDRSSARGFMTLRGLYIFSHQDAVGNAPAHTLFERIQVTRKAEVDAPRQFAHYTVKVDEKNLPDKVTLTRLVG